MKKIILALNKVPKGVWIFFFLLAYTLILYFVFRPGPEYIIKSRKEVQLEEEERKILYTRLENIESSLTVLHKKNDTLYFESKKGNQIQDSLYQNLKTSITNAENKIRNYNNASASVILDRLRSKD